MVSKLGNGVLDLLGGLEVGEWESGLVIIRSNATSTSYFTTFLQNVDVANLLLIFI